MRLNFILILLNGLLFLTFKTTQSMAQSMIKSGYGPVFMRGMGGSGLVDSLPIENTLYYPSLIETKEKDEVSDSKIESNLEENKNLKTTSYTLILPSFTISENLYHFIKTPKKKQENFLLSHIGNPYYFDLGFSLIAKTSSDYIIALNKSMSVFLLTFNDLDYNAAEVVQAFYQDLNEIKVAKSTKFRDLSLGMSLSFINEQNGNIHTPLLNLEEVKKISNLTKNKTLVGLSAQVSASYQVWVNEALTQLAIGIDHIGYTPMRKNFMSLDSKYSYLKNQNVHLGVNFSFINAFETKTKIGLEFDDILKNSSKTNSFWTKMHMGQETEVLKNLYLALGINQGYGTYAFNFYFKQTSITLGGTTEEISENVGLRPDTRYFLGIKHLYD